MPRPRTAVLAATSLVALGFPAAQAVAVSQQTRAADSFTGHVSSARGHWHGDHGRLSIRLVPSGSGTKRRLLVRVAGARCGAQPACVKLGGTLTGTITALSGKPDVGRTFAIMASGTISPLGRVRVTGRAQGTGFIARGRVTLRLTLIDARGSVSVSAMSALVPGFTSP